MELSYRSMVRRARGGGVVVRLDPVTAGTIWEALSQTRDLLDDRAASGGPPGGAGGGPAGDADDGGAGRARRAPVAPVDPFDAIVAQLSDPSDAAPPEDPVLRRLLPDGLRDDREAAAEFRAATERGLRARKAEALGLVMDDLGRLREGSASLTIPPARVRAWLTGVNDARLALGSMLQVRQGQDLMAELDDYLDTMDVTATGEDAGTLRAYRILMYDLLSELQDRIVRAAG